MAKETDFKTWFMNKLGHYAPEIAIIGADEGWKYITETNDCIKIYDQHEEEIWKWLNEEAERLEYSNTMEFVTRLKRVDIAISMNDLKVLLVWFACDYIAEKEPERFSDEWWAARPT